MGGTAATAVTRKKLKTFLVELAKCGNVTAASAAAGFSRVSAYRAREKNAQFAKAWDDAVEKAMDALEAEAYRRAFEGTEKPVYQQGRLVGTVQEYSDTLAMFLLNGRRASVFKHRAEVTGLNGGPVTSTVIVLPAKDG